MNSKKQRLRNRENIREALDKSDKINQQRIEISGELSRVSTTLNDASNILDDIEAEFEKQTQLQSKDVQLLIVAVALQVVRQYFITQGKFFNRDTDKKEAERVKNENGPLNQIYDKFKEPYKESELERGKGYYKSTVEEIVTMPVPFDTQINAGYDKFALNLVGNKLGLGGGNLHRYTTLGHDPILGLIFGTANIATRTATVSNLQSFHIRYGTPGNLKANGLPFKKTGDYFSQRADTMKVLKYGLLEPIESKDPKKMAILTCALVKELIHLKSDVKSVRSLPLPFMTLSPEMANKFSEYKIDTGNVQAVTKQAVLAIAINRIISLVHRMMFVEGEENDGSLEGYKVRTRKIITYANLISSSSNIIAVAVASKFKTDAVNYLDVGGIMVTIVDLFRDIKFVSKVKEEFLRSNWENRVMGNEFSLKNI
ncbi:hypothetical protein [Levilactobacillus fuyuanensis]|uniref:Uncharacterized protein n=1 Tax=Levilactobacillus fuyuanensis TaxID=2486022 RepID=A0ABW4H6J3_9LACO|nr:hypothetical protein [Levilactobacillus fuyuanensis]